MPKRQVRVTMNFEVTGPNQTYAAMVLRWVEEAVQAGCEASGGKVERGRVEAVEFGIPWPTRDEADDVPGA